MFTVNSRKVAYRVSCRFCNGRITSCVHAQFPVVVLKELQGVGQQSEIPMRRPVLPRPHSCCTARAGVYLSCASPTPYTPVDEITPTLPEPLILKFVFSNVVFLSLGACIICVYGACDP